MLLFDVGFFYLSIATIATVGLCDTFDVIKIPNIC